MKIITISFHGLLGVNMYTIFKYQIPVQEKFTLNLPDGANIIRVEDVDGMFFMWAMVDTEKEPTKRYFECYKRRRVKRKNACRLRKD